MQSSKHTVAADVTPQPRSGQPLRVDLLNTQQSDGGWSLGDIVQWLFGQGRHISDPCRLISGLGDALHEAGAPLWRMRLALHVLHPEVAAWGFTWVRGVGASERRIRHGFERTDDYIGSPMQYVFEKSQRFRRKLQNLTTDDHSVLHALGAAGGVDYVGVPLTLSNGKVSCCFVVVTDDKDGFGDADLCKLEALTEFLAPIIEAIITRDLARSLLDTYVGPRTGERVLRGLIKRGDGEIIRAALWYSDLRDFTKLTENLSSEQLLATLNAYFELVAAAVTARRGEILRFIGDAMLIVFPAACEGGIKEAARDALDSAQDAFSGLAAFNHRRRHRGEPELRFGVGLHVGEVIYGNVGAPNRLDFTVMGPAVNRTARLEGLTKRLGAPLLMSADFAQLMETPVRSLGTHEMAGVTSLQEVFALEEPRGTPSSRTEASCPNPA